ncbi:hypothetical protein CI109_100564 [Kwoniella shandongensis]|uniref:Uncharacterized protein n=1 Tax=Kwoniella shandongensis TaxID=1734106 RepID=A0A5M6BZE5_9TREE|nr:uncharacterized protein CI109_003515 [Kwoniella shandongensis]KAA5528226.1 hypothetical protein CI109_003515 [Kwoniella shandongensis]
MVKSEDDVISDFNDIVNMTADELDTFLKTEGSETTGFKKDDGSGESIGHESGRKIVEILKRNPDKDPSKYTDEDVDHMRRVVSYCKRHLAQETKLKDSKSPEELEKSKSTRSLKNWGHDPMKTLNKSEQKQVEEKKPASKGKPASKKATSEKPKSSGKPASKKAETKPASKGKADDEKKADDKAVPEEDKVEEEKSTTTEKPKSRGKPASKGAANAETKTKNGDEVETGDKREAENDKPAQAEKPASKKAKTTKEPTEGTRKPPSRNAKKA